MKIFLCGCNGCGKTQVLQGVDTSLNKISGITKTLNYVPNIKFDSLLYPQFQLELLNKSLTEWIQKDDFISSNSIFNIMANVKYGIDTLNQLSMNEIEKYNARVLSAIMIILETSLKLLHKNNTMYFFIKKEFNPENYDKDLVNIQHYIEFLLKVSKVDYITVSGTTDEIINEINSYIK